MHFLLENADRIVIKIGTHTLTDRHGGVETSRINKICWQIKLLCDTGISPVVVSSGAVGLGMSRLAYSKRPTDLTTLQACAAVGQSILTETWQAGFAPSGIHVAQILLTREDVRARKRHVAVKNLFEKLLADGIVPIVNENDSVSGDELCFGDNDVLSAMVASLVKADMLLVLTTMPGLIDRTGSGEVVPIVSEITPEVESMAGGTDHPAAVGGMRSKVEAAKLATKSGCGVFIGSGTDPEIIHHLLHGEARGTFFAPKKISLASKKRWLAFFEHPRGTVVVDAGARDALLNDGRSLLATGVVGPAGDFAAGDTINISLEGVSPFARGISQFGSTEILGITGHSTREIRRMFPSRKRVEIIHRDSMVMLE